MTLQFTKRIAAELVGRGINAVRIKPTAMEDAKKAITRDDVRKLIADGNIFTVKAKHNISANAKELKRKRQEGRKRGTGRRRGTRKARKGMSWEKKIRSQRTFLKELRAMGKINSKDFKRFYMMAKGNIFANKASMLLHIRDEGISISDEELAKINESIRSAYR